MANHDVDVPIKRLHPELLSLIFLANTSPTSDITRLRTARSSSQVCQEWRHVIISLSSLWGRLIDINRFQFADVNNPWRNEVLRRTGSALLWIKGYLLRKNQYPIFISFLEVNWSRIEYFDFTEGIGNLSHRHDLRLVDLWKGLEAQAPNLRSFGIKFVGYPPPLWYSVATVTHSLFKDGAPLLREISIPDIKFDVRSSWLSNISKLNLSTHYSVQEILQILRATACLTRLHIVLQPQPSPAVHVQNINLPLLETFSFTGHFLDALPVFRFLDFPASCTLKISLNDRSVNLQNEGDALDIIRDTIAKRIQKHLDFHGLRHIVIDWGEPRALGLFFQGAHAKGQSNLIITSRHGGIIGPGILEDLSLCSYLPPVTEMSLDITAIPCRTAYLTQFLSCSRSLTTLTTNEGTLKILLYENGETLGSSYFPSLQILRLTQIHPCWPNHRYPSQVLWGFFQVQVEGGSPISVLDLAQISWQHMYDMEYLDNVPGLKVVEWSKWYSKWTGEVSSYECGSGHPEVLRFDQIFQQH